MLDLVRGALGDLLAVVEHRDSLADAHDDFHVVLDEQHGESELLLDESDQLHQLDFLGRVHPGGRFVEQEQLWPCGERANDFEPALIAVGQRTAGRIALCRQTKDLQQLNDVGSISRSSRVESLCRAAERGKCRAAVHVAGGAHVVENAERTEETDVLKCAGDAAGGDAVGTVTDDRFAGESDPASGWPVDAGDQIEDGRFAGAVRADEADEFPSSTEKEKSEMQRRPPNCIVTLRVAARAQLMPSFA